MPEHASLRHMMLLERLARSDGEVDLDVLAAGLRCDVRTVRRDIDRVQQLLASVRNVEVRYGKARTAKAGYSPGYFTDQLQRNVEAKALIARQVVHMLPDETAVALTAGTTPYIVAREIRRAVADGVAPRNLIMFTNSLPALLELIAAGIATGVFGEAYSAEDCAFYGAEMASTFHPGVAIVGASGVTFDSGELDLYSHRADEAAFLRQVIGRAPEVIVTADRSKLGRLHPWNFGGKVLDGKMVTLVTDLLADHQAAELDALRTRLAARSTVFAYCAATAAEPEVPRAERARGSRRRAARLDERLVARDTLPGPRERSAGPQRRR